MKTQRKGPFLGINNRLPATALHVDKVGDFLADAENIDIDNAGQLRRRQAAALIHPLAAPHSLYMTSDTAGFMVMASELYAVTLPTYSATSIKALTSNAAMSYAEIGGVLFYSNGTDSGRIVGGVALPMAFPTPDAPTVAGGIGGDLPAGKYRVAVAYCNAVTGEEGGVSPSQTIATIATGGLRITLPPTTTGATNANVYLTTLNGSVLMLSTSVVLGLWPTVDVIAEASGRPAMQRHEKPLPAGRLFAFQGALCSFKDHEVYEGLPHRHGYCRQLGSRIPFVGDVSNVVPTENGVYVVADETFWLAGPAMTEAEKVSPIMPYGGVPGTAFTFPDDTKRVGWFGADGVVIADKRSAPRCAPSSPTSSARPSRLWPTLSIWWRRALACRQYSPAVAIFAWCRVAGASISRAMPLPATPDLTSPASRASTRRKLMGSMQLRQPERLMPSPTSAKRVSTANRRRACRRSTSVLHQPHR